MGSNKRTIHDLTRDPPEELRPLFELVTNSEHPDASVALLGCSILDHVLGNAVIARLQGRIDRKRLLNDRGPLGDFNSKIVLADALGIIAPSMSDDLHRVRRVRNAFAHAPAPITFNTPEVAAEIDAITVFDFRDALNMDGLASHKLFYGRFIVCACFALMLTPKEWVDLRDGLREWLAGLLQALTDFRGVYIDPPEPKVGTCTP